MEREKLIQKNKDAYTTTIWIWDQNSYNLTIILFKKNYTAF